MGVDDRKEKIGEIAEMMMDIWHDADEEGCSLTEKITEMLQEKVEEMVTDYVEKMKEKIIAKLERNMEKIVAKQAAKLATKAGLKSAWGVGTAWHACSAAWCLAMGDTEGNSTVNIK